MKTKIFVLTSIMLALFILPTVAQVDSLINSTMEEVAQSDGFHSQLKTKFVEGSVGFMSLVAITLILGLAFCIERIIYLTLSEINAKKLLVDIEKKVEANDIEGAKTLCRDTRGPVASICYQGLMHIEEAMDVVERSIVSYGSVQSAKLEKGCSWITLFIAIAPSKYTNIFWIIHFYSSITWISWNGYRYGDVV